MKTVFAISLAFLTVACGKTIDPNAPLALECKGKMTSAIVQYKDGHQEETRTYFIDPKANQVTLIGKNEFGIFCEDTCQTVINARSIMLTGASGSNPVYRTRLAIDRNEGAIAEKTSIDFNGDTVETLFSGTCHPIDIPDNLKAKF